MNSTLRSRYPVVRSVQRLVGSSHLYTQFVMLTFSIDFDLQVETALRVQLDYLESLQSGPPPSMQRDLSAYRYIYTHSNNW